MNPDVVHDLTGVVRLQADNDRLREENAHLRWALDSRIVIEQAKGLVAGAAQVDVDEAFDTLRQYARSKQRNLQDLCRAVIEIATARQTASPVRLARTPLYAEIMECWRERPRAHQRVWKVPAR